jgi:hypothetical protein
MTNIIYNLNVPQLNYYINHPYASVEVKGNIHRSQWTSDNPNHNYWVRVSVNDQEGFPVVGLSTLHIFLCFRIWNQVQYSGQMIKGQCVKPKPVREGSDYPDVSKLFGNWETISWSDGPTKKIDPNYKKATKEELKKMKTKSSTSPEALEFMKKIKEKAKQKKN